MQCWNIRQLIKGLIKKGNITGQLVNDFIFLKKKYFEKLSANEFDYFIAGYMLGSNPYTREEFTKLRKMNEKIRNNG